MNMVRVHTELIFCIFLSFWSGVMNKERQDNLFMYTKCFTMICKQSTMINEVILDKMTFSISHCGMLACMCLCFY